MLVLAFDSLLLVLLVRWQLDMGPNPIALDILYIDMLQYAILVIYGFYIVNAIDLSQ